MEKMNGESMNIEMENIKRLKELFPEVFTEDKIDFKKLQLILGEDIEESEERYSFNWHGKRDCIRLSQTPTTGTLRPDRDNSKNFDETENLYIEGDNLEVLKLLQKSYHGKIKMIYIDPPYNTGKDFVYKDNYRNNMKNYLEFTEQIDEEGHKLSTNTDTSGRYHTDWLNMMYPRLRLARNLLTDDGVIFISIDDNEVHNLRNICDEIFGEDNFVDSIVWEKVHTRKNSAINFSSSHEYILVYAKRKRNKASDGIGFKRNLLPRENNSAYSNPDNDPKGPWKTDPITAHNYYAADYKIKKPNGVIVNRPKDRYWAYSEETWRKLVESGAVIWGEGDSMPMRKRYLSDVQDGLVPITLFNREFAGDSSQGKKEVDSILVQKGLFDYPKPTKLIKRLLQIGSNYNDLILDFFSGSSTTAHAVMDLNAEDGGNRKFIMVQLPEPTDEKSEAYKAGYKTIADIGRERIRRAGDKILEDLKEKYEKVSEEERKNMKNPDDLDIGFKSFKLDSSNIKEWNPEYIGEIFNNKTINIEEFVNNLMPGREQEDLLYEIILKYGIDLTTPIEEHKVEEKIIYNIGFGSLFICLEDNIDEKIVKEILKLNEENKMPNPMVVFKDTGFKNDEIKLNAKLSLNDNGIEEVVSI